MMCICGNARGKANVLGDEGMTVQRGALLPQSPLPRTQKRIFIFALPVRASGSTSPSLLHDLVEVRAHLSVSP